jgi:prolyl oligopeptidase
VQEQPAYFATEGLVVSQHEATSKDGTKIPYFLVTRKDAPAGPRPTLLYGYGGFEVSMTPSYATTMGPAWLEQGGTYVLANIRGGGEFGPAWHQAALREKRHKAFEDFIAVGEDLVARGITEPKRLGIMGGSNGGLLVGAAMTQRPDLFGAVVCQVPLLDMLRYSQLLAGASWIDEYGDPADPKAWDWIKTWSPYQQLKPGTAYPHMLLRTSTRDDRVHPGHARKMAAKLRELGQPVDYWENIEGGHGGAADNRQRAFATALDWTWLAQRLELGKVVTATTKD